MAAAVADLTRAPSEAELAPRRRHPLFEGRLLRCPACERQHDLLAYIPLRFAEKYAECVVVVLKCPNRACRHLFALHP